MSNSNNFKINTELSKILNFQQITLRERNKHEYGDSRGNLYIENGILIYQGPNGTITPIANR